VPELRCRPDLVGQRREAEIDAFLCIALCLSVERLMLTELLDGIVFWTPLVPVTPELGPVIVLPGSHHG
jgi:ectoine hydroxylase-related dioxygenase (phytanoyl-CoA dioxygenase family)